MNFQFICVLYDNWNFKWGVNLISLNDNDFFTLRKGILSLEKTREEIPGKILWIEMKQISLSFFYLACSKAEWNQPEWEYIGIKIVFLLIKIKFGALNIFWKEVFFSPLFSPPKKQAILFRRRNILKRCRFLFQVISFSPLRHWQCELALVFSNTE